MAKLDFDQRQEVAKLIEVIAAGGMAVLEQELYTLVYDRDCYKAKAEGLVINERPI